MNILNVHTYQGMQNAVLPRVENNTTSSNKSFFNVTPISSASSRGNKDDIPWDLRFLTTQIDNLQKYVETDLNIVRDPPFFPIATFQRADLIKRVRVIEEAVQRLGLEKDENPTLNAGKLKDQATDREIAATLDKLFAFRDRQESIGHSSSAKKTEPGTLLAIKA